MPATDINKIYVIESLESCKSGTRIYEDALMYINHKHKNMDADIHSIETLDEFNETLDEILNDVINDKKSPFIHLEMHGNDHGLKLTKESNIIEWKTLKEQLTKINVATSNRLLLSLAACEGGYITKILNPLDRAPYFGMIGPFTKVKQGDLEQSYKAFFKEFSESFDGDSAMYALRKKSTDESVYGFASCEAAFKLAYKLMEGLEKPSEELNRHTVSLIANFGISALEAKKQARQTMIQSDKRFFERSYETFFMTDIDESNKERFKITYNDIRKNYISRLNKL